MLSFGHARPPSRRTSSTGGDAGFSASPLPIARSLSPRLPDSMIGTPRSLSPRLPDSMIGTPRSLSPRLPDSMIGTAYQDDSTAQLSSTSAIPSVSNAQVDLSIQVPLQQVKACFKTLTDHVDKKFEAMQKQLGSVETALKDLSEEMKKNSSQSFAIKGSTYEMAVTKVLTIRVIKDEKYKFDEALRFFQSMGGLDDVNDVEAYCQNLALFRKFIRHCSSENQVNHSEYRHWVDSYYSSPDEDKWQELMQEDAAFDYQSLGHGMGIQ
ncbi:hypothetical protein EMCRGX_G013125 [Ephydatia muelleri]